jgi:hypothetical protein
VKKRGDGINDATVVTSDISSDDDFEAEDKFEAEDSASSESQLASEDDHLSHFVEVDDGAESVSSIAGRILEADGDGDVGGLQGPPVLRRRRLTTSMAETAAKAATGLRSSKAPPTAPPRQLYVQDCSARLHVFVPPRQLPGASMLLLRKRDTEGTVVRHSHLLDEHLPLADVIEQSILLEIKSTGTFSMGSAQCRHWLGDILPQIGAIVLFCADAHDEFLLSSFCGNAEQYHREYAASSFRMRPILTLPSLGGSDNLRSPAGHGRQRRGHHAPHEYVLHYM